VPIDARIPLGVTAIDPNGFTNALAAGMKMRELRNAGDRAAYKDEQAVAKSNALSKFYQSPRGSEDIATLAREASDAVGAAEKSSRDAGLADAQTKKYKADNAKADIVLMREASGALLANPTDENFDAIMASVAPRLSDPAMPKLWHTQWYSAKTPEAREGYARAWSMSAEKAQGLVMDQAKLDAPPKGHYNSYTREFDTPPATGAGPQAAGPGPQGSSTLTPTEDPTYRYFKTRYGLSDTGAFALSRNITQESGHQTDVKGDGGKAQGLAQWHPDRYAKLVTWAQGQGLDPASKQAQMDYIMEEGKGYPGYESLKGNDPQAVREFIKNFEGYGTEGARFAGLDARAAQGGSGAPPTDAPVPPAQTAPPVDGQQPTAVGPPPVDTQPAPVGDPPASVGGPQTPPTPPPVFRSQAEAASWNAQRRVARDQARDQREERRVAALGKGLGPVEKAELGAHKKALGVLEQQRQLGQAQLDAADKAFDIGLEKLKGIKGQTNLPFVQGAVNEFNRQTGDENIVAADNAIIEARNEYAKVLSGATGAAGITEGGRDESAELFKPSMSIPQFEAAIATAKRIGRERMTAFLNRSTAVREDMHRIGQTPQVTPQSDRPMPKPVKEFDAMPMPAEVPGKWTPINGIWYQSDGKNWVKRPQPARQ
jgi:hypothetical protein